MMNLSPTQQTGVINLLIAEEVWRSRDVQDNLANLAAKGIDDYTFSIRPSLFKLPEAGSLERVLAWFGLVMPNKLPDESVVEYFRSVFGYDSIYYRGHGSVYAGENRLVVDLGSLSLKFDAERIKDDVSVQKRVLFKNRYPALVDLPQIEREVEVRSHLVMLCYAGFSDTKVSEGLKIVEPPFEMRFEGFL